MSFFLELETRELDQVERSQRRLPRPGSASQVWPMCICPADNTFT